MSTPKTHRSLTPRTGAPPPVESSLSVRDRHRGLRYWLRTKTKPRAPGYYLSTGWIDPVFTPKTHRSLTSRTVGHPRLWSLRFRFVICTEAYGIGYAREQNLGQRTTICKPDRLARAHTQDPPFANTANSGAPPPVELLMVLGDRKETYGRNLRRAQANQTCGTARAQ
jgi:hypothetical protein